MKSLEQSVIYWVYDYDLQMKLDPDLVIFKSLMDSGDIDIVQFRAKGISLDDYLIWSESLLNKLGETDSIVVANDFCEAVDKLGLDGVHIGQSDMPLQEARELLGDKIIGATARSFEAADNANEIADYIGAGTVFQTTTKEGLEPKGPSFIKEMKERVSIPVFPIGGIDSQNAVQLVESGIKKAAIASCLLKADDPQKELLRLCKTLK